MFFLWPWRQRIGPVGYLLPTVNLHVNCKGNDGDMCCDNIILRNNSFDLVLISMANNKDLQNIFKYSRSAKGPRYFSPEILVTKNFNKTRV